MDYLPNEVEKEVLIKKTGVSEKQARKIIDATNRLRHNSELPIDVSTRTTLMIGEMVASNASLSQVIATSLQTNKETLESILLALHMEKGYLEKGKTECLLFVKEALKKNL